MPFEITILGTGSALPVNNRFPSAQIVNIAYRYLLLDCGEGTQMQLGKYKIPKSKIDHIFISHLHGDHYFGLIGLLTSYNLMGRTNTLHIYSFPGIEQIINLQLDTAGTILKYGLAFHTLSSEKHEIILDNEIFFVESFPLNHRIPCCGFLISEKPVLRKFLPEKATEFDLPLEAIPILKAGKDYSMPDGKIIKSTDVTIPGPKSRKFAYITDTRVMNSLASKIKLVDLLYHESTFVNEHAERAYETYHSTALQAAEFAMKCKVKQLVIGHFSAKYRDTQILLEEALSVFKETKLAEEGKMFSL